LIGGLGADEDPIDDGANPHPLPNIPFGGIWDYQDQEPNPNAHHDEMDINGNAAPQAPHAAPAADLEPMIYHRCTCMTMQLLRKILLHPWPRTL
jgi:hypothetical protein